jgi:molybdopterin molybdotransferase
MPEFLKLIAPEEALTLFLDNLPDRKLDTEPVPTENALGRVLRTDFCAPHPLPPFPRTTVDGFAVRAADTFGASSTLPAYLTVIGEISMGTQADLHLNPGEAALVHTGGMIPVGADAVVMVEDTQNVGSEEIEVLKAAAPGDNTLQTGEDVQSGDVVIPAGRILRSQEIGGLMALGKTMVEVVRKPRVSILSTGDEVVAPDLAPSAGQVRDINSYTLSSIVAEAGATPVLRGIIQDNYPSLHAAVEKAHQEDDLVIITAGSSVSTRDITAKVIAALGEPGVLVHGISIRPGKPTILAVANSVPLVGLPGNPVSAFVVARLVVLPVIRKLLGTSSLQITGTITARLSLNISSKAGREDYLPVKLVNLDGAWIAEPVFGRSNLIFTLVRAHGLVRIHTDATGLAEGSRVQVELF